MISRFNCLPPIQHWGKLSYVPVILLGREQKCGFNKNKIIEKHKHLYPPTGVTKLWFWKPDARLANRKGGQHIPTTAPPLREEMWDIPQSITYMRHINRHWITSNRWQINQTQTRFATAEENGGKMWNVPGGGFLCTLGRGGSPQRHSLTSLLISIQTK